MGGSRAGGPAKEDSSVGYRRRPPPQSSPSRGEDVGHQSLQSLPAASLIPVLPATHRIATRVALFRRKKSAPSATIGAIAGAPGSSIWPNGSPV